MTELPEIYKDSIDLFYSTFDVPKLCFEIISRVKNPATCGKLYEVEVISAKMEGFKVKIEFKTNEDTYFMRVFNLENRLDAADEFIGLMGASIKTLDSLIGKRYKVYYENVFNTVILGKVL